MGSYRGRLDIIADILHVTTRNAKKTHIMYQANLGYRVLQRYLRQVTKASLVSFEGKTQSYVLTRKGIEFLEMYKHYLKANERLKKHREEFCSKRKVLESLCTNK